MDQLGFSSPFFAYLLELKYGVKSVSEKPKFKFMFKKKQGKELLTPTQMKFFPSSPLLLEPPRLLNLDKKYSLPFF